MKRITLFVCAILFSFSLAGQIKYEVVSAGTSSKILDKTGAYVQLHPLQIVTPSDMLYAESEWEIQLEELTTGKPQVYKNVNVGYMTVAEMIVRCNQKSTLLCRASSTLQSDMSKNASGIRWSSVGSGSRSMSTENLASLLRRDFFSDRKVKQDNKLKLVKHIEGHSFYPEFVNNTSDTLFVNFLAVDSGKKSLALCFNVVEEDHCFNIVLPPGDSCTLRGFNYSNSKRYEYIVFGTLTPFSSYELTKALQADGSTASDGLDAMKMKYGKVIEKKEKK